MSLETAVTPAPAPFSHVRAWALAARAGRAVLVSRDGEVIEASSAVLRARIESDGILTVHAPFMFRRLALHAPPRTRALFDLAELFAFVHPARFAVPTARGLAAFLGIEAASSLESEAALLHVLADRFLAALPELSAAEREGASAAAVHLKRANWAWADAAVGALGLEAITKPATFEPWSAVSEWEDSPPRPEPGLAPIMSGEASAALSRLLSLALSPAEREERSAQGEYAEAAAAIFAPREREGEPHLVLAEAGTGIGKTLGYLAPSALWARRNEGQVWVSTYTKNLQRQIAQTLAQARGVSDRAPLKTVVRKGRENYLCLLNLQQAALGELDPIAVGLVGRWLHSTQDGDMIGGDFPAWLAPLLARTNLVAAGVETLGLTDRRGECIYGACAHYRRCFIEHVQRRSEEAELIVANHALTLTRAATESALPEELRRRPLTRMVLDEGHSLFNAADDAFSAHLTANEMADLRRWIRGYEDRRRRTRGRNLLDRVSGLVGDDKDLEELLQGVVRAALALPSELWRQNLGDAAPASAFLSAVEAQVFVHSTKEEGSFGAECPVAPASENVTAAARALVDSLGVLQARLGGLARRLAQKLHEESKTLMPSERGRLEAIARSLLLRAETTLPAWRSMLACIESGAPEGFVDWFAASRAPGQADIGMHRHHLDPTKPLAETLYKPAHGVLVTSATLFDVREEDGARRLGADRVGSSHLAHAVPSHRFASPFPYAETTRFIIVRDVDVRDLDQLAAAMRVLFEAACGGALGLFTAIGRLRAVHKRIAQPLERLGLPLYAQHVDEMDAGTLVDIFRFETSSCLLGTDAVRDGIDVPGRSLRLIVLERVPWPRPDLLHKARREPFGGRLYEEEIVRRRLAQAYGRLIRRAGDKGVFVLLGAQTPSRLLSALPEGVAIVRTGLADAARQVHEFVG